MGKSKRNSGWAPRRNLGVELLVAKRCYDGRRCEDTGHRLHVFRGANMRQRRERDGRVRRYREQEERLSGARGWGIMSRQQLF